MYLIHEDRPSPGRVALLVPLENGVFGENVSLVQQEDNLVERLQEHHVIVTEFLEMSDCPKTLNALHLMTKLTGYGKCPKA